MSKQERDAVRLPPTEQEPDVGGHVYRWGRGEAEAPADAGERSEEDSQDPDVESHGFKINWRGEAEAPADAGEVTEETEEAEADVEGHLAR